MAGVINMRAMPRAVVGAMLATMMVVSFDGSCLVMVTGVLLVIVSRMRIFFLHGVSP
jgi:hypothetical protein